MKQQEKAEVIAYLEKYSSVFNEMAQEATAKILKSQFNGEINPFVGGEKMVEALSSGIKLDAKIFMEQQRAFWEKQQQLWQGAVRAMMGEPFEPLIEEDSADKRFADGDWRGNPAFSYVKQAYLLNAEYVNQMVDAFQFEDKKIEEQVRFYTRQLVNSMSPSNYVFTNPEVCREILATEGECLAKGIDNFIRDMEQSPSEAFKVSQVDINAFKLGKDLAYTPGSVVYKNHLIELIQYHPSTEQVYTKPLLIVPPFINKYYILDLDQKKSMVRWLTEQGFTVFMISWVNPNQDHAHVGFEHYVQDGVIAALDVVQSITEQDKINVSGYCVGGTLLGITQNYLQQIGDQRVNSMTLLTTLFDFSEPGEVGNFLTGQLLPMLEQSVASKGYMDGRVLALGFSLLRENNLFWSFFIDNYLKGKDPVPFDVLYWNSDSTNLPAPAYLYYLNNMYIQNKLKDPGGIQVFGRDIDLSKTKIPCYSLAAIGDHIVLWQAAYRSAQLLGSQSRFVLTESGHVAGVVNPANKKKYGYWVSEKAAKNSEAWFSKAKKRDESWWNDWNTWLVEHSGEKRDPPAIGNERYQTLYEAPGLYVLERLEKSSKVAEEMVQGILDFVQPQSRKNAEETSEGETGKKSERVHGKPSEKDKVLSD